MSVTHIIISSFDHRLLKYWLYFRSLWFRHKNKEDLKQEDRKDSKKQTSVQHDRTLEDEQFEISKLKT